jgi:hypothetical protein
MKFESANPSVVRSIKQRELLNTWLRALRKPHPLPGIAKFQPDRIGDELPDMMGFDVEGEGDAARFVITQEGATLTQVYGNEHVDPAQRTNRYLDDAIGPERYTHVVTLYRTCLARKRPTYSISLVQDLDGKDVQYERLLLPFGRGEKVEQLVGSYKAISMEGRFKIRNLMGIRPRAEPAIIVRAVIDQDIVRSPTHIRASEDIVVVDTD